ncbi:hypothetical protein RGQ30_04020 [Limnobacter thiooxidans]|uniref:Uncharacterized protein n=1 Tax=Limnobacter thiooxidans TaxID=131080 RepID=A0AA86IZ81_9BURK|nr:hypothetical protein RGQ30_04020 [Limnobacter thiooxidans]
MRTLQLPGGYAGPLKKAHLNANLHLRTHWQCVVQHYGTRSVIQAGQVRVEEAHLCESLRGLVGWTLFACNFPV